MAITTLDGWVAAAKQRFGMYKTATRTTVANISFSLFDSAGSPAGTLAGSSTAAGVVPTNATAGYPTIKAFGGGASGYLGRVEVKNTVVGLISLYDRLFLAGAYAFNASTTLASQPSYSSRVPGGTNFVGTEIWIEAVTAFTGNLSVAVTYTNQDGTTGRTTGTIATGAALIVGRCLQLPLQAGDTGVEKIESVTGTIATVGTFNVMVLRPLTPYMRIPVANGGDVYDFLKIGMPEVYANSALYYLVTNDSTSSGLPYVGVEVING